MATFAKKFKDLSKDSREVRLKVETAVKKTETNESKIHSTRTSVVDMIDKIK